MFFFVYGSSHLCIDLPLPVLKVNGTVETLDASEQTFGDMKLSMDLDKVNVYIMSINVTVTFDGTTAHIMGILSRPTGC